MEGLAQVTAHATAAWSALATASGPATWTLQAWIGVCAYLAAFLLVAWIVWKFAGPEEEDPDDLGNQR